MEITGRITKKLRTTEGESNGRKWCMIDWLVQFARFDDLKHRVVTTSGETVREYMLKDGKYYRGEGEVTLQPGKRYTLIIDVDARPSKTDENRWFNSDRCYGAVCVDGGAVAEAKTDAKAEQPKTDAKAEQPKTDAKAEQPKTAAGAVGAAANGVVENEEMNSSLPF